MEIKDRIRNTIYYQKSMKERRKNGINFKMSLLKNLVFQKENQMLQKSEKMTKRMKIMHLGWEISGFNYQMLCKAFNREKGGR